MKTKDCVVGMGVYIKENFQSTLSEIKAYRNSRAPTYSNDTRAAPLIVDAIHGDEAYIKSGYSQINKVPIKNLITVEEFALKQSELKVKSNELEEEFSSLD